MGIFDAFKSVVNTVTKPFKTVYDTVKDDVVSPVWNKVIEPVAGGIWKDAVKPVFSTGMGLVEKVGDTSIGLIGKAGDAAITVGTAVGQQAASMPGQMFQTLNNPMMLITLAIGGIVLLNVLRR